MTTENLLDSAKASLNAAQNEPWVQNTIIAQMLMQDAQTRALIAITQELKRFNDNKDREGNFNGCKSDS